MSLRAHVSGAGASLFGPAVNSEYTGPTAIDEQAVSINHHILFQ